jgi:ABC-type multidrug transport system fused ATPase/permease subunit
MTSVERVLEYTKIQPEAAEHNPDFLPPPDWPMQGNLEFNSVCLAYSEEAGKVLKNINFNIQKQEKVRIKCAHHYLDYLFLR